MSNPQTELNFLTSEFTANQGVPLVTRNPDGTYANQGNIILQPDFVNTVQASILSGISGINEILLTDASVLDANFDLTPNGEYDIDSGTTFVVPANTVLINRPLKFRGSFAFRGQVNGSQAPTLVKTYSSSDPFINTSGNLCDFVWIEKILFATLPMLLWSNNPAGAPPINALDQLFLIDNGTDSNSWGQNLLLNELIALGWGKLGEIRGFDFGYQNATNATLNVTPLDLQYFNDYSILSYRWNNGLSDGATLGSNPAIQLNNIKTFSIINSLLSLNPAEFAFDFPDNPTLQKGNINTGIYNGLPNQAFTATSLTKKDPRIVLTNYSPIDPSRTIVSARLGNFDGTVTETPATANDYYLLLNDFVTIIDGTDPLIERLEWVGTGRAQRLVNRGDRIIFEINIDASFETTGASALIGFSIGKNLRDPNIAGFDNPITNADAEFTILQERALETENNNSQSVSKVNKFVLETDDYLQFFIRSNQTDAITLYNFAIEGTQL